MNSINVKTISIGDVEVTIIRLVDRYGWHANIKSEEYGIWLDSEDSPEEVFKLLELNAKETIQKL